LQGIALESLAAGGAPIDNLTPLQGAPLQVLDVKHTGVSDLAPLRGLPLKEFRGNPELLAKDANKTILKQLTTLQTINGQPAAEFWKQVDGGEAAKP
jgi:hypothetical protein